MSHPPVTVLLLLLAWWPGVAAGQQGARASEIPAISCAYADGVLGTDWSRGPVTAARLPSGEMMISSQASGRLAGTMHISVTITHHEPSPPSEPHGQLHVLFLNDGRLAQAMLHPDTTSLALFLDDSLHFDLGTPVEGEVQGATRSAHLTLHTALPRGAFLALARARKGRVTIAGRSYSIGRKLLEQVSRAYRAVICMAPVAYP